MKKTKKEIKRTKENYNLTPPFCVCAVCFYLSIDLINI